MQSFKLGEEPIYSTANRLAPDLRYVKGVPFVNRRFTKGSERLVYQKWYIKE